MAVASAGAGESASAARMLTGAVAQVVQSMVLQAALLSHTPRMERESQGNQVSQTTPRMDMVEESGTPAAPVGSGEQVLEASFRV